MPTPRRPRTGRSHRPRHSTGGLLGSRPARVVAAGLAASVAVVGGVVVAERTGEQPERVQAQPAPSRAAVAAPSTPAPTPAGTPVTSPPPAPDATTPPVAPERRAGVSPEVPAAPPVPGADPERVASRGAGRAPGPSRVPAPADPVDTPVAEVPAEAPAEAPVEPSVPAPVEAPAVPPAEVPAAPAPTELELLSATLEVPEAWRVPRREVTIVVPGPEPVEITGEVSSPEPGRVAVEVTLTPAPRHLVEDPAPETGDDVRAAQDHRARHLQGEPVG